jgi:hypothetical protein
VQQAGRAAKLACDSRASLSGVHEFLRELYAPLQIGNARLSLWRLSIGVQALVPCVVPLPPSVPFSLVGVSSGCRWLGVLGVMDILAEFPVVPQSAKLLLYLVKYIVGQQCAHLLIEFD